MTNQAFYDIEGEGPAIVFLHAALADRRMWGPQWERFKPTNALIRIDLRGFGNRPPATEPFSHAEDVLAVLDEVGLDQVVLVGGSMGGRVCLEVAMRAPDRVAGLMLLGSAMASHEWSQGVRDFWQVEHDAFVAGDLDAAVQANLDFWLDGPNRERSDLSQAERDLVATMQRNTFEVALANPDTADETRLADFDEWLSAISVPCRVLYGTEDPVDLETIAHRLTNQIPGATLHPIANAAHLPSLERPEECNQLLADLIGVCF